MTLARRVLDEKRRVIWPIAAGVALNVALFLVVVFPLSHRVSGGEADAQRAAAALASARQDYAAARATVTGKASADTELQKFYKDVLPVDYSEARRITYLKIYQLAQRSNLEFDRRSYEPIEQKKGSELGKLTTIVLLSGDYRDIRRFIYALETSPEFLVLENVALSSQESERGRGLNVSVQVATYYRAGSNGE